MFAYYNINEQKGRGKERNQGSKGENIYKDKNKFTFRPNAKNKNWMETLLPSQTSTNLLPTIKANLQMK